MPKNPPREKETGRFAGQKPPPEGDPLPVRGPNGCYGLNAKGNPCRGYPLRDGAGIQTRYCLRHTVGDDEWREMARRGGRRKGDEERVRKLIVDPERGRELLRVVVKVFNEGLTIDMAIDRLIPWFAESSYDKVMLRQELEKLKTYSEHREDERIERNTERLVQMSEGISYH
jgi:hypothetical protein